MTMRNTRRLAILCGGGPAPGINSVIGAVTIRSVSEGVDVLGIRDGFKWLLRGDTDHVARLTIEDTSRIHFTGGSHLGTSWANPTRTARALEAVIGAFERLGVSTLISIGGDDTAFSALKLAQHAGPRLRVVIVPGTIDNDLDLPHGISTCGYQTARHVAVQLVKNLMIDTKTTGRWYILVTMGRKAGHLALGIGKAAGATLTVIPEEFAAGPIKLDHVADIVAGAIIKRKSAGHADGTAILAEGLIERLPPEDLNVLGTLERDEYEHLRPAELDLSKIVKARVRDRLAELGLQPTLVAKDTGYELRCADLRYHLHLADAGVRNWVRQAESERHPAVADLTYSRAAHTYESDCGLGGVRPTPDCTSAQTLLTSQAAPGLEVPCDDRLDGQVFVHNAHSRICPTSTWKWPAFTVPELWPSWSARLDREVHFENAARGHGGYAEPGRHAPHG